MTKDFSDARPDRQRAPSRSTTARRRSCEREHLSAEDIEFMRWRAERWMKLRHFWPTFSHSPWFVLRHGHEMLRHTFRGSSLRSMIGLETDRAGVRAVSGHQEDGAGKLRHLKAARLSTHQSRMQEPGTSPRIDPEGRAYERGAGREAGWPTHSRRREVGTAAAVLVTQRGTRPSDRSTPRGAPGGSRRPATPGSGSRRGRRPVGDRSTSPRGVPLRSAGRARTRRAIPTPTPSAVSVAV